MNRRAFLGWTGLTSYGTWALLKPPPQAQSRKPPKSTTTTMTAPTAAVFPTVFPEIF